MQSKQAVTKRMMPIIMKFYVMRDAQTELEAKLAGDELHRLMESAVAEWRQAPRISPAALEQRRAAAAKAREGRAASGRLGGRPRKS